LGIKFAKQFTKFYKYVECKNAGPLACVSHKDSGILIEDLFFCETNCNPVVINLVVDIV
jgi:hypothetical protein